MKPVWKTPPRSLDDLTEALSSFQSARAILKETHALCADEKVLLRWIPNELRKKLETVQVQGTPIASFFTITQEQGMIWCDRQTELGVLMIYSFHEMVHATDPALWALNKKTAHPLLKEKAQLNSELRAFRAQHQLVREIESKNPGFRAWLKEKYPTARVLHEELTEAQIIKIYSAPQIKVA